MKAITSILYNTTFLTKALFFIAISLFCLACESRRNETTVVPLPNFIIVMADDLGYGDLGSYGHPSFQTPHLDSMATNGLQFTDYHSNGAVCSPTRAALLTGKYQQLVGMEGVIYVRGETRQTGLDTAHVTLAELLKSAGYATGIVGKWHLGYRSEYNPVHQGFDFFRGYVSGNIDYHSHYDNAGIYDWWNGLDSVSETGYVTDLISQHATSFIKENHQQPFFLYIAHEAPHWPYQGRNDPADRFPNTEFNSLGSRPDYSEAYQEMVEVMDESVGKVLATLDSLQLSENTLVFFCSDNGAVDSLGNNGVLRGHKTQLWEGGHRVPAIAHWPGTINPGSTDATVLSMDVLPTLLSLAELDIPSDLSTTGVDFSPVFSGKGLPERTTFWRYRGQQAVRQGDWKLLVQQDTTYLFDLQQDIAEQENLAVNHPEKVNELLDTLNHWEAMVDRVPQQTK
ncbi:sulfatase-like hydrolase/transferase [Tunicatimonas pelagia]|uniref:sulfatase-like hydrolase/transferase n=1 Tax=Tunicatimonas pelagia TaxID=931531 RepID=UPI002664E930|nr:sulfatase-like hydrolase/transferase [Tunicatimonas pelagia]WKN43423.1 sulfatase-like hydrolase/transferase [Tunicatimonas pelagia]